MDIRVDAECWLVRAGHKGEHIDAFVSRGFISLGFARMDLGDLRELDDAEIEARMNQARRQSPVQDRTELVGFRDMRVGDVVVTVDPAPRDVVLGVVADNYEHTDTPVVGDHRHHRAVRWLGRWNRDHLPGDMAGDLNWRRTVRFLPDQAGWRALVERVADGGGAPVDGTHRPRRIRRPGAHDVVGQTDERRCPSCQLTRAPSMFKREDGPCRDCV